MKHPHRQLKLRFGNTFKTVNVADRPDLKVGNRLTLKDSEHPDRQWLIIEVGDHLTDKADLNRGWNNNI